MPTHYAMEFLKQDYFGIICDTVLKRNLLYQ